MDGGQELTIERPAYEAKKFTFYRVKTAPKEAGIESGRSENGVVKCVFTPEAFLDIPVAIPGLPQPVEVNMAPNATVGDLKRELQSQLKATQDLEQILVLNEKVLSNFTRLRSVLVMVALFSILTGIIFKNTVEPLLKDTSLHRPRFCVPANDQYVVA